MSKLQIISSWQCKHCKIDFNNITVSFAGNHTKHCLCNPNKQSLEKLHNAKRSYEDELNGKFKVFNVTCLNCGKEFGVKVRENKFDSNKKFFCSRKCANSRAASERWLKSKNYRKKYLEHYRTIYIASGRELKCEICGFDAVVDIHHLDLNHKNNSSENLVCLCPNHHKMIHMKKYRAEIKAQLHSFGEAVNTML